MTEELSQDDIDGLLNGLNNQFPDVPSVEDGTVEVVPTILDYDNVLSPPKPKQVEIIIPRETTYEYPKFHRKIVINGNTYLHTQGSNVLKLI